MQKVFQNKFQKAISDIPVGEYKQVVEQICNACDISYSTFRRWLNESEKVKHPYQYVIASILNKDVKEIFDEAITHWKAVSRFKNE